MYCKCLRTMHKQVLFGQILLAGKNFFRAGVSAIKVAAKVEVLGDGVVESVASSVDAPSTCDMHKHNT